MDKKEIKQEIQNLLLTGVSKQQVFDRLTEQGMKDRQLAYLIASYPKPSLLEEHHVKRKILLILTYLQVVLGFLVGFGIGMGLGGNADWYFGIGIALFVWLFAYGFHKNYVGAYNAFIMLSIFQLSKAIGNIATATTADIIGILISIAMIVFVWHLRTRLFPDFAFMGPKKSNGRYVFTDQ